MKKIILSAGGTGGHVFPACALSLELRKNGYFTVLITDQRGKEYVNHEFNKVVVLPIRSFNCKFFLFSPFLFFKTFWHLWGVQKVIAFGGYTSFFPILIAILSLKAFYIIQMDAVVTRLNRLFINYALKVFYLFPQTKFKKISDNYYLTGIPIRSEFSISFLRHSKKNFVISVICGSLGSSYWKELLENFAKGLLEDVRTTVTLYIQTCDSVDFLDKFNFCKIITDSFFDTANLFKKSHLVITRCGASALAEIAAVGRPAFLVPWENALENHQFVNAMSLLSFNGAACGNYLELLKFFFMIYDNEQCFMEKCCNMNKAFFSNGKKRIVSLLD